MKRASLSLDGDTHASIIVYSLIDDNDGGWLTVSGELLIQSGKSHQFSV